MWEIKQSATPKTVDIYIYSAVESDSEDWWTGEKIASETSANTFRDKLAEIKDIDNINIYINSLGGSVMEGVAIYNQLKRHKAQKTVYVDGFACSIASVIAMAGDKVIMPKNTVMMIHNAWTYCRGNASELRKMADDLDKINEVGKQAYLDKANGKITAEELTALMDSETYLTAEECVKYGFADEYSEYNADIERAKNMLEEAQKTNVKQYCEKLTKICAIADKNTIPQTETFEEKAIKTIKNIFGGNIDVKY
jgi:ATP-dependent Clp endopeptidase proteolytic subunit ClpP